MTGSSSLCASLAKQEGKIVTWIMDILFFCLLQWAVAVVEIQILQRLQTSAGSITIFVSAPKQLF